MGRQGGGAPWGFFVPFGIMARDFNVGTANQAGNLAVATDIYTGQVADPLRRANILAGMGATILTGLKHTLELPRFASSTSAAWKGEIAAATEIQETSSLAVLTPKRLPVYMLLSRQALIQGNPSLDGAIARQLTAALMEMVCYSAINDDGTNETPVGIRSTSGIGSVVGGSNGAQLAYSHLADLESAPTTANAVETEYSGYVVNSATRRWCRTTARAATVHKT